MLQSDYVSETSLIGQAFLDNKIIANHSSVLKSGHFGDVRIGKIWGMMVFMHAMGEHVCPVSLASRLEADSSLNECGGIDFVLSLDNAVSATQADQCVKVITAASRRRRVIDSCNDLIQKARDNDGIDDAIGQHVSELLHEDRDDVVVHHELNSTVGAAVQQIKDRFENRETVKGITTGYTRLDEFLGGWTPKRVYILSAASGRGKSAMALNFMNAAIKDNANVVYISLEMDAVDLAKRLISIRSSINGTSMLSGNLNHSEIENMLHGVKSLSAQKSKSIILDKSGLSIGEITSELRKIHNNQTIDLLMVDYLQLVRGEKSYSREREVASISASLIDISKMFSCPVIALSQINDQGQIRESRSVENDATAVMRIDYVDPENASEELAPDVWLKVLKNRHGPTGSIPMTFIKTTQTFAIRR